MERTERITIGQEAFIDLESPSDHYAVVFEDDGATGYFYALDTSQPDNQIIDAMHIYNVASAKTTGGIAVIIRWSEDGLKAELFLNDVLQASYDFKAKKGICKTGFPPGHA